MTWDQLVSTALLGTERRPVESGTWSGSAAGLAGRAPTDALLGAAALAATGAAAGVRPSAAPALGDPAPADEVPAAGPQAAPRLWALLRGRDRDLVETVLNDLVKAGRRVPDECLPALLDVATRAVLPGELVSAALGRRGRWLAAFRPEWAAAVDWFAGDGGSDEGAADEGEWLLGTPSQRVQWLVRARRQSPDGAREALAASWLKEKAADRATFVEALASGLAPADEPFLTVAMADRSDRVRQAARTLLLALPGSTLRDEVGQRAAACVQLESGLLRRARVVVTPPVVNAQQSSHELVAALVSAAPLATWIPLLGNSPAEVLERPVAGEWQPVLRAAWLVAAQRERDPDWGFALLAGAAPEHRDDVLPLVPVAARYALVAEWLRTQPVPRPAALLQTCPAPWPDELTAAVVGRASHGQTNRKGNDGLSNTLARLTGLRADPAYADAVHRAADALPADHPDQHHLSTMATLLTNRHRLLKEIA